MPIAEFFYLSGWEHEVGSLKHLDSGPVASFLAIIFLIDEKRIYFLWSLGNTFYPLI